MTTTDIIPWAIAAASLLGTIMNLYKDRRCFYIWTATNLYWVIYDAANGLYSQSVLMMVYFIISIAGIWKWKRGDEP